MMPSVQATLDQFLAAFARLDLDAMLSHFDDEATAFFPVEHQRLRLNGKAAIRDAFAQVLARVRASGASGLRLDAEDVQLQNFGAMAVVTLHLSGEHLSRRTFVLRQSENRWLIVHFHGSNAR
jgi:ketosteroid isomerase-like protein